MWLWQFSCSTLLDHSYNTKQVGVGLSINLMLGNDIALQLNYCATENQVICHPKWVFVYNVVHLEFEQIGALVYSDLEL